MPAGATYEPIATTTLGSATNTITFSSISGSYTDLILVVSGYMTAGGNNYIRFNNDSGTNYSYTRLIGYSGGTLSDRFSNQTQFEGTVGTSQSSTQIYHIMNYSNSTTFKTTMMRENNNSSAVAAQVILYRSTSAINRVDIIGAISNTFVAGSTFTLYGIAAA